MRVCRGLYAPIPLDAISQSEWREDPWVIAVERPHQTLDYRTPAQAFEEGRNQVHQSEVRLTPELVPA